MTTRVRYLGEVPATTVAGTFNTADVSLSIASASGQPTNFPFDVIISRTNPALRERIRVGGRVTTTYNTITRAMDGTTPKLHNVGESVELCVDASNLDELNQFLGGTAGDTHYYDGTSDIHLAIGASNTVMKSTGTAPAWSTQTALLDTLGGAADQKALVRQGGVWVPTFLTLPQFASTAAATAASAGVDGAVIYVNSGDSAEGLYCFNGTSWRPVSWNAPWGVVTSVTRTTSQTGISTIADITSMSITFTRVLNRQYRLSAIAAVTNGSTANAQSEVDITDNSNTRVALGSAVLSATGVIPVITVAPWTLMTGAAGSVTYKLRAAVSAGTVDVLGATTAPMYLMAEDIGPSGVPA